MKNKLIFALLLMLPLMVQAGGQRIGFFSGTFDPPHAGHRDLIERSIRDLKLDVVVVTPGANQTHKPNANSFEVRDAMTKAAFSDIPQVQFLDEKHRQVLFTGGINALKQRLSEDYSEDTVYQIMGDDSLERLQERTDLTFQKNDVIAVAERDADMAIPKSFRGTPVVAISKDTMGLSSTKMRALLAEGKDPSELSKSVLNLIHRWGLYGARKIIFCSQAHFAN